LGYKRDVIYDIVIRVLNNSAQKLVFNIFAEQISLDTMRKFAFILSILLFCQGHCLIAQEQEIKQIETTAQEKEALFFQKLCFSQTIFPLYEDIFGLDAEPTAWISLFWPEDKFGFLESKYITISNEQGGEIILSDELQHSVTIRGSLMGNSQAIDDKGHWLNFRRNFVGKINIEDEHAQKSSVSKNLINKAKIATNSGQQITIKSTRIGLEISDNRGNNALIEIDRWGNRTLHYPNKDYIAFEYLEEGYQISSNFIDEVFIAIDGRTGNMEIWEGTKPPYRIINEFRKPTPPDDPFVFIPSP